MRPVIIKTFCPVFVLFLFGTVHADFNKEFVETAKKVKPSVVNIIIFKVTNRDGRRIYSKTAYGSGTIISKDGYIVTNYHVVKKGNYYQVIMHDGAEYEVERFPKGECYIADQKTDLALMKIREAGNREFPSINFGDSTELKEGEWVMAIGNPFGLKQSITCGIVSSKGRNNIGFTDIEDFIQTDVPINPGNSGGPLVNLRGELVGINTAIRTLSGGFQGISFSIPSNIVKQVCYELMRYGRIRRGWLGFIAKEQTVYRQGEKKLIEVISVIRDSPAEKAGICRGDRIREVDGKRINSLGQLIKLVGNKPLGSALKLTISREGYLQNFVMILREREEYRKFVRENKMILGNYGFELNENSRNGTVVVSYISPMGYGFRYGIRKGDIVESLNGNKVESVEEFMRIFNRTDYRIKSMEIVRDSRLYTIGFLEDDK